MTHRFVYFMGIFLGTIALIGRQFFDLPETAFHGGMLGVITLFVIAIYHKIGSDSSKD